MTYKLLVADINNLLYDCWDPIGVNGQAPRDEYESYVPVLIKLAFGEHAFQEVAKRLGEIEVDMMQLPPSGEPHRRKIAAKIIQLAQQFENPTVRK